MKIGKVRWKQRTSDCRQIHARKGEPGFHIHPGITDILCVSKSMLFFCTSEQPLYRFFSQCINLFVPKCMPDILTGFQIFFPYVPGNHFFMFFALGTSGKIRAGLTDFFITFVFFATFPVRCSICKSLVCWTQITVIVFVILISMPKPFSLSYNGFHVLLSCSFPGWTVYPKIQPCLSHAVSTLYANTCLCSPFRNQPLSGSEVLHFCVFAPSGTSPGYPASPEVPPPASGGVFGSSFFSFSGFFPCFFGLHRFPFLIPFRTTASPGMPSSFSSFYC